MKIDEKKQELRQRMKSLKKEYSSEALKLKSEAIFSLLEKDSDFQKAKTILAYWSLKDEVFTHDFVVKWWKTKQFLLPVVNGDSLDLKNFEGLENMKSGSSFGILEPQGNIVDDYDNIDLIIVPGLAFDKNNNRLGRGKAFYDKLLKNTKAIKIGVCFDFQFVEEVPADNYDIGMDKVLYH